jgi:hypothetical protein
LNCGRRTADVSENLKHWFANLSKKPGNFFKLQSADGKDVQSSDRAQNIFVEHAAILGRFANPRYKNEREISDG